MQAKYLSLMVFVWVVVAICSVILAGTELGPEHAATYDGLMSWSRIFSSQSFGVFEVPGAIWSFFTSMWTILVLNFTFIQTGPYTLVIWIVWGPIIALVVFGIVSMFFGLFQRIVS